MLVEHVADRNAGGDGLVVVQRADRRAVRIAFVNEPEILASHHAGGVADGGIDRDAAPEMVVPALVLDDLAHHVDAGDGVFRHQSAAGVLALHFRDHADEPARAGEDANEVADGGARQLARLRYRNRDASFGAAHSENDSEPWGRILRVNALGLRKIEHAGYLLRALRRCRGPICSHSRR